MPTIPTSTADINPAPTRDPFTLNESAQVVSRSWLTWLKQIFTGVQTAYSVQATQAFNSDSARDIGPEVQRVAELVQETPAARYLPDLQELRAIYSGAEAPRVFDDTDLRRLIGSQEVNRPGTDTIWVADTHGVRLSRYPAAAYPDGSRFYELDRASFYIAKLGLWLWAAGTFHCSQATLPADLGPTDTGFRASLGDYNHELYWNGTGWQWASNDDGSGYFRDCPIAPSPAGAWQICDGSATTYLNPDGTTGAFTTPNLTAGVYRKGAAAGAYTGALNAAGTATFTGTPVTPTGTISTPVLTGGGATPTGVVSQPTFTGVAATPAGTVSQPTFVGDLDTSSTGNTIQGLAIIAGTTTYASATTHAHTFTPTGVVSQPTFTGVAATPAGTVSQPTFTGNPLTVTGTISTPTFTGNPLTPAGTVAFTGDPVQNIAVPVYFRR